jgi:Mn2+/Fe2+ NRAMP family transporter
VTYIPINRVIAILGMSFGGLLSMAVLVAAALAMGPNGVDITTFDQAAQIMTSALPKWGLFLFAVSMLVACLGAALEISLAISYFFAQGFGWNWGESVAPSRVARFSLTYTIIIYLGDHRNGWISNAVVAIIILISFVLAVISIPLQLIGG